MRNIFVIGAGKSSYHLINYLLDNARNEDWHVTVGDASIQAVVEKTKNHPNSTAISFDINNDSQRANEISKADIVISLLPPALHFLAALECLKLGKNLVTASYVSPQMHELHEEVKKKGILFLNECGLDPGLDHMSAMELIDNLKSAGAEILSFKSYTGGLIAPESNDNPWGYKFTWNPKNVIIAGQGTARCIIDGNYKYIPYSRLFTQIEKIEMQGLGVLDGYANRDSLQYRSIYNLPDIPTLVRGTLRYEGYCSAWNLFVQLGLTDDSYKIENSSKLTYADLVRSLLPITTSDIVVDFKKALPKDSFSENDIQLIKWTGILEESPIRINNASPAEILLYLLIDKWKLKEDDLDLVAMQHLISYNIYNETKTVKSSLIVKGENQKATAMSKTVGLPMAIAAKNILNNQINTKGVCIPVVKEIYAPLLNELENHGIHFQHEH